MTSDDTKKGCVQCSMRNVFIENSEKNGFKYELIPQDIGSMECFDKGNFKWLKGGNVCYNTIDLNDYPYPHFFSKVPMMLLLDDLLGVDVTLTVDCYYSFCSTHMMLKYKLGHKDRIYLQQATVMCKEILKSGLGSLPFERSMFFTKLDGNNLLRIYLKDLGLEESELTIKKVKDTVRVNEIFEKITVKIRGRRSGHYENALKGVSPETTYIQIEGANLKLYLPDIFKVLINLRKSIYQK
jgi:hypothetical protein